MNIPQRRTLRKAAIVLGACLAMAWLAMLAGCTVMTQSQKDWIELKADRASAMVSLMDADQTTREQEQAWIRINADAWGLWKEKVKMGYAAPSWAVKPDPQPVLPVEVE